MTAPASAAVEPAVVTDEDRFLFDLQGFLLLRGALAEQDRIELLAEIERLESMEFDISHFRPSPNDKEPDPVKQAGAQGESIRLNSLLRISTAFDRLIDYPAVLPYLQAFMNGPQLGNAWSISKFNGTGVGGWHRGLSPEQYTVRHGKINTRMLNTVYFLTENGPDDGCMAVIPGGHKSNFDLDWGAAPGTELTGATKVIGQPGDILIFSETLLHTGLAKTTEGRRSNIYLNYVSKDFSIMMYSPQHNRNFAMPPSVRGRFTDERKALTEWMAYADIEESSYL